MKTLLVTLVSLACTTATSAWTPPENPSPSAILQSAGDDVRHQRYEDALAKHVWYHKNALKYDEGQGGVRLSFALSDWKKLGEAYPPALDRLIEIRDEAGKRAKKASDPFLAFHDFAAINRVLDEEKKTAKLFKTIDERDPDKARRLFGVAEPALLRSKEYGLCGKYLDPGKAVPRILHMYDMNRDLIEKFGKSHADYTDKSFTNASTTLVALLVVNDRKDEAKQAAKAFRHKRNDSQFRSALDKALEGEVPRPWP